MKEETDRSRGRMKTKGVVLFACVIFMVFLIVEIGCAPKGKTIVRNWGPQSILYLKGRYGRRYTSEKDEQYYKLNLEDFSAFFKSNF
ncbi:spexin prohormone 2 [Gallus gallus]|nr:spexin prohormone 2 [Gallus gallus]XP_046798319.1 spexin prohormone 2 [Gallus gallus]|eukprot:XP_025007111.1 spexin-like [Gallus gallus]